MNRDELLTRVSDYLDGLLDDDEARAVEDEVARDPALLEEARRVRAVLFRPYPVAPPPADLPRRVRRRLAGRPYLALVRYAAVFAAGALTTLLAQAAPERGPRPDPQDPAPRAAPIETAVEVVLNKRIR